jgi:Tfp pilus assembly protein PilO
MKALALYSRYLERNYGLAALASIALSVIAVLFFIAFTLPTYQELYERQQEVSQFKQSTTKKVPTTPQAISTVDTFYQQVPPGTDIPKLLERLFDVAFENEIYLGRIDYEYNQVLESSLYRYHMSIPVRGDYKNMRSFINQLLKEIPTAALDNINFNREDIGDTDITANLQISLFLRK